MLTQALIQPLLAGLSRTLGRGPADPDAAAALLDAFRPETPLQAMLAAQAIALHHAAMDCFGRAMEAEPEDHATAARLQRNAASLTRAFTATLRTLQRSQAEAAQEEPLQREDAAARPEAACVSPAASEPAEARSVTPGSSAEREALDPRFREDDSGLCGHPATIPAKDPVQREQPAQPRWEDLTEAEQFALLYPDRAAAGATSHEDADLWLPKLTSQPVPQQSAR